MLDSQNHYINRAQSFSLTKRKRDNNEDEPPSKIHRILSTSFQEIRLEAFPADLFKNLDLFLDNQARTYLRLVSHRVKQLIMVPYLERLKSIERNIFTWKNCVTEEEHYWPLKILQSYILNPKNRDLGRARETYQYYKEGMQYSPLLGAYIWKDLTSIDPTLSSPDQDIFKAQIVELENLSTQEEGASEVLLQTLNLFTSFRHINNLDHLKSMKILSTFQCAIAQGVTDVSDLILKRYMEKLNPEWIKMIAMATAVKQDYRALDFLVYCHLKKDPSLIATECVNQLFKAQVYYPPFIYLEGSSEKLEWDQKEALLLLAEKGYGKWTPLPFLKKIIDVKYHLQKFSEAEAYVDKVKKMTRKFSFLFLCRAVGVKYSLKKFLEAEFYVDKLMIYENIHSKHVECAVKIKIQLLKWQEAKVYFDRWRQQEGSDTSQIRIMGIVIHTHLNEWPEAEFFIDSYVLDAPVSTKPMSVELLYQGIVIKSHQNKQKEAEEFCNQIVSIAETRGLPSIQLFEIAIKKYEFKDYQTAYTLIEKAMIHFEKSNMYTLTLNIDWIARWYKAGKIAQSVQEWYQAEKCFAYALQIQEKINAPISDDLIRQAVATKLALNKENEAQALKENYPNL